MRGYTAGDGSGALAKKALMLPRISRAAAWRALTVALPTCGARATLGSGGRSARPFGSSVWREINLANLRENIAPSRDRAHLVLEKGADHRVKRVRLRKL